MFSASSNANPTTGIRGVCEPGEHCVQNLLRVDESDQDLRGPGSPIEILEGGASSGCDLLAGCHHSGKWWHRRAMRGRVQSWTGISTPSYGVSALLAFLPDLIIGPFKFEASNLRRSLGS